MAVTTLAVVSAAATVGSVAAGISAQSKAAKARSRLEEDARRNAADIFGTKPEFEEVDYNPLYKEDPGYANIVSEIISGNQRNLPAASTLSADLNKEISAASRTRIEGWDPSFQASLNQIANNRDMALGGYLPYEDALGIAGNRGRLSNDLGIAGGSGAQTAKDLGLARADLMFSQGPQLAAQLTDIIGAVDPIQRHSTPEGFLLPTQFGVGSAIQENQFGANFDFNQNMAIAGFNALPDPQAQGLFNTQAFNAGFAGSKDQAMAQSLGQVASLAGMYSGQMYRGSAGAGQSVNPSTQPSGAYYTAMAQQGRANQIPVPTYYNNGTVQYPQSKQFFGG